MTYVDHNFRVEKKKLALWIVPADSKTHLQYIHRGQFHCTSISGKEPTCILYNVPKKASSELNYSCYILRSYILSKFKEPLALGL